MNNSSHHYLDRIQSLQTHLIPHQAQLISIPTDIRYFSSFVTLVPEEREGLLLITSQSAHLFHAHFSPYAPVKGITHTKGSTIEQVCKTLTKLKENNTLTELLIDPTNLIVAEYWELEKNSELILLPNDETVIWQLRAIKDELEIQHMRQAARVAAEIAKGITNMLRVGLTEIELRNQIESLLKEAGSEQPAFPTIVAYGPHSALPHHQPTHTPLTENTPVLVDFGATIEGYRSDMTRTFWFGSKPDAEFTKIEKIVHQAYDAALNSIELGKHVPAQEIDNAARTVIQDAEYGEQFIHTTGHGLGLDIHEKPSINWKNTTQLQPNMVITIEPGIYLEEKFGYRYENTLLITPGGAIELTI